MTPAPLAVSGDGAKAPGLDCARTRPRRWADLQTRLASALVLAPLTLGAVWFGAWPYDFLVTVAALVLAWEWARLFGLTLRHAPARVIMASVLLASIAAILAAPGLAVLVLAGGFLVLIGVGAYGGTAGGPPGPVAGGVLYIGLGIVGLIALRADHDAGRGNVLFLLAVVWASDIGAYLLGRLVGGPKLLPAVSPAKTWAGAGGGLGAAVLAGLAVAMVLGALVPGGGVLLVAALLAAATQAGDLFESWIKRRCGAKDASRLIPGHGGLLDRVDGLLVAAPLAALLARAAGPGAPIWSLEFLSR